MIFYLLLASISLLLYYNYIYKRRGLPPGPAPLPFLGNILALATENRWETKFCEWKEKYGSTFTYWLGEAPFVAVCDYKDMQKYFVKHADIFSDRMDLRSLLELSRGGVYGIVMTNGDSWKEHRRFALKTLRDFGLGKNQMEERIITELHYLLERVNKALPAEEIDFFRYSDLAVGSIINAIMCGYSFVGDTEDEFYRLKDCSKEATRAVGTATAGLVFMNPYLMKVPVLNAEARIGVDVTKEMISYFDRQVEKHLKENDYTQDLEPTDFLDAFLVEREKKVRSNGSEGHFSLNELSNVCFDIWSAGQETTSETITWTIAYLILYPEAQEKLQTELDTVIGSNRIIRNSDRPDLPYTNAVIMESQRCGNIVSQNIPRAVTEDITLDGFSYKKGTVVLPQISVLLQDPKIFPEPEKFNPDRFIDQNGKLRQVEELIPFSIGKRICLGEGMARMELFLFTANLFNQYKFSAGKVPPSLKKESGASSKIVPYKCRIELRK